MSGWDKPSHSDRPDDGSDGRGDRFGGNEDRPFPRAPFERDPFARPPERDPFERVERDPFHRDRPEAEDRPFPGAPEYREPFQVPKGTLSMEELHEVHAKSNSNAEFEAYAEAHAAQQKQWMAAGPETSERADERPNAGTDRSPQEGHPGIVGDPENPEPVRAESSTENSEGTQASEAAETGDKPVSTDKDAERVEELETELAETKEELAEAKDDLAETQGELAETKTELAEERSDRRKLTDVVADQADEIKRLRAQLEAKDHPTAGNAVRDRQLSGEDQDASLAEKKPERSRLPSTEVVAAAGAGSGILEAVATHGHLLTTWEGTMATATAGFGVALYGWAKKKHDAHEERKAAKDADRPED